MVSILKRALAKTKRTLKLLKKPNHEIIFTQVYKNNVWGNNLEIPYYSGGGSDDEFAIPYIDLIVSFINDNKIGSIVDLGCGDFRIGRKITDLTGINYIGVDIVNDLIEYNQKNFSTPTVNFYKKNIVKDKIPTGELYLVRQVFQHLSNSDIKQVLKKLSHCKYLIITEHQPTNINRIPNIDKFVGAGIRLESNSGVYLEYPPFNKKVKKILEVTAKQDSNSKIATFIIVD